MLIFVHRQQISWELGRSEPGFRKESKLQVQVTSAQGLENWGDKVWGGGG